MTTVAFMLVLTMAGAPYVESGFARSPSAMARPSEARGAKADTGTGQADSTKPDLATISARLGMCTADFTVTDAEGKPVYAATVHVRLRYGFLGLKRMDLEVGTNSDGKARVEGLPLGGRRLVYDITKETRKTTAEQDLTTNCHAMYTVALK